MIKTEAIALELLEYKLNDIQAQRPVAGGMASVWDLYHYLNSNEVMLSGSARQQLEVAGTLLKRHGGAPSAPKTVLDTFEALVIESFGDIPLEDTPSSLASSGSQASAVANESLSEGLAAAFGASPVPQAAATLTHNPAFLQEQQTLQQLARDVWWFELEGVLQQLAVYCRVEKDRYTARLLYALLRNIERYSLTDTFTADTGLSSFEVMEPVPDHHDPLASLNNIETLTELVREVVNIIMTLAEPESHFPSLKLPREKAFAYLRGMATLIAQNPYAGQLSLIAKIGPSSEQLRFALQEMARDPVPLRADEQRRQREELELRLKESLLQERRQKELFQEDVAHFTLAVANFFDRLEPYLPRRVGGKANDPSLPGGVLFAQNPALRLAAIPKDATAITVNVKGPIRFSLGGLELAVMGSGHTRVIFVAEREFLLQPRVKVNLGNRKLFTFLENDYLHVQLVHETRSLAVLLAQTVAVLCVLSSPQRDALLTLLRTAATIGMGDASEVVAAALARLTEMTARAPKRRDALEGFLMGAARASKVDVSEAALNSVVQRFHAAMVTTHDDFAKVLTSTGHTEVHLHALSEEPLSLQIAGQPVTVRKYRRGKDQVASVVVMLPGRIIGSFTQSFLRPFPGGTLLCARSGDEFAALYYAGVTLDA